MKIKKNGYSLLEVLVVISIFSFLAIVSTTALLLAIRGAKKSDASARIRQSLDFSIASMERHIRSAKEITQCPLASNNSIDYTDPEGVETFFTCVDTGTEDGYIASGAARLTPDDVSITECNFVCNIEVGSKPESIDISIKGEDKNLKGSEGAQFSTNTKIFLRSL